MNEFLVAKFTELGVTPMLATIATQVYLELTEVKKYWDPTYEFNKELKSILIRARKTKRSPHSVFVPISVHDKLSFDKLQEILRATMEKSVFLAILHPDSTCIYYQVAKDLLEPLDTSAKHKRVDLQEKLDSDLKKNRKILEQAALFGFPITIVDKTKEQKDTKPPCDNENGNLEGTSR